MKTKLILIICLITLFFSCTSRNSRAPILEKSEGVNFEANADMLQNLSTPPPPPESNTTIDKKIIKTAYISIEVENYLDERKLIDTSLKECNAYIVNENLQNTESQISNSINIKVPANQFDNLLDKLSKIAKKVDYQNIETKDVTEEYIDIETRLANSRKVEQTYLRLLRRTNTIEDILKIEQKLSEIRTDIESTEGRLKYLNHQVSFSTISLNVYQNLEYKYNPENTQSFFQRLKRSISMGWNGIVTFFLFLIRLWPLWILLAIGFYLWKYVVKTRKERKKDKKKKKKLMKKENQEEIQQPLY